MNTLWNSNIKYIERFEQRLSLKPLQYGLWYYIDFHPDKFVLVASNRKQFT